jgi:hypothetical protein
MVFLRPVISHGVATSLRRYATKSRLELLTKLERSARLEEINEARERERCEVRVISEVREICKVREISEVRRDQRSEKRSVKLYEVISLL